MTRADPVEFTERLDDGTLLRVGNLVDVSAFPPGNLGQQVSAESLSVVPASDIPDDTYIGDVRIELITEATWATIIDAVRLDDDPTFVNSAAIDSDGWSAAWVLISIESTLAPTDIRIVAQFTDDGGTTWWDFVEGLWASLYWEDTGTATEIRRAFLLPLGGIDNFRIRAVATGSDAGNFFDVTVRVRNFRGNFGVAHA